MDPLSPRPEPDLNSRSVLSKEMQKEAKAMNEERPLDRKICFVNVRLLPLKLHFLFFFAGIASVVPFLPLFAKQLGISSTGIGIVYFVIPLLTVIAKLFCGWLVDKFRWTKLVVVVMILTSSCFYIPLIFVPPLPEEPSIPLVIGCDISNVVLTQPNISCVPAMNRTKSCKAECTKCSVTSAGIACNEHNATTAMDLSVLFTDKTTFFVENISQVECNQNTSFYCELSCPCDEWCCEERNEYTSIQFWSFFMSNVFSGTARRVIHSLSDSLCYDMLGGKTRNYGKQRLWGSIGRSFPPVLTGYLLDTYKSDGKFNYAIAIYMMLGLLILDILAVWRLDLSGNKPKESSESICKDVFSLFGNLKHVIFSASVSINGVLCGLYFVYYFVFMEEIGASKLLTGISVLVRLVSEVPCFFFAGKIIAKLGHFNAVIISFIVFSARLLSYVFIYDPMWALITEMSHGFTFGFFYAAMTSYAKHSAQSGTEATFQGLLGALFDGVGMSIGNLLGGLGFDYYGSRTTFLVASVVSAVTAILTFVLHSYSIYRRKALETEKEKRTSEETTEEAFDEFDSML